MAKDSRIRISLLLQLVFCGTLAYSFGFKSTVSFTPALQAINLKPDYPNNIISNSGGKFGVWDGRGSDLAGIKVSLAGNSLMQPAHFDCDILAHVVSGAAKWGMIHAEGQWVETAPLEEGDSFVIPKETTVWFYNDDVSDVSPEFAFVGFAETSNALKDGVVTVLPVIGSKSMYLGFDDRSMGDAWALEKGTVKRLTHQQDEALFLNLKEKIYLSNPEADKVQENHVFKTKASEPEIYVPGGGKQWSVVASMGADYAILNSFGLGGQLILQRPNSLYGPAYSSNSDTLIYVVKGKGHIWIVEPMKNQQILDIAFFEGQILSVPRDHGFLIVADTDDDLEHFQVANHPAPSKTFFAGKRSPYLAIPWEILRVSFDVDDTMLDKLLHSRTYEYTLLPPYKGSVDRDSIQAAAE
ncbi:hypothetical protein R1flu_010486 [Riccia fluitans]|uniref:Cupin type-1 domain-containing protein n=1 Tax=Riccia fluitans TaxID=41844 RepID=A0ABD1Z542_9MARC